MHVLFEKLLVVMVAMGVLATGAAFAADKVLPIGATVYPPFEYAAADGKRIGSDTEIIEQVIKRMGYVPEMRLQPWKRVELAGRRGDIAAIYSVLKTAEREELFYFSDPISASTTVFFKRKEPPFQWKSFDALKTMRVAVCAGYAYPKEFVDAWKQSKFAAVVETFGEDSELTNLRNLKKGLVDLVITDVNVGQYLISKHKNELDGIDYSPREIGSAESFYLAFSKKWPNADQLVKEFNAELAKFVAAGERKKIFDKYGMVSGLK